MMLIDLEQNQFKHFFYRLLPTVNLPIQTLKLQQWDLESMLMRLSVNVVFTTDYAGLKSVIDYINTRKENNL